MKPLAFNTQISLRAKPKIALAVLPTGLMFFSFVPLVFFTVWLTQRFGIPDGHSVKDSLEISTIVIVMPVFMSTGYLLGWIINAVAMRLVFKWPKEKVRNVFLFSKVPPEWRKNLDMNGENTKSKASPYVVTRQKGVKDKILATLMFLAACLLWIFVGNYVAEYCKKLKIGFPHWVNYLFLAIVILALCHFNDVFQNKNKDNDT